MVTSNKENRIDINLQKLTLLVVNSCKVPQILVGVQIIIEYNISTYIYKYKELNLYVCP